MTSEPLRPNPVANCSIAAGSNAATTTGRISRCTVVSTPSSSPWFDTISASTPTPASSPNVGAIVRTQIDSCPPLPSRKNRNAATHSRHSSTSTPNAAPADAHVNRPVSGSMCSADTTANVTIPAADWASDPPIGGPR